MKVLLDTNVIIHREAYKASHLAVGQLFRWLDELKYTKCIHPITEAELRSHANADTVKSMGIKLEAYVVLKTTAPVNPDIQEIINKEDKDQHDKNDSLLLNELVQDRVDAFITEDRKIHQKANALGVGDRVFTISHFVEKSVAEHPELVQYKVLSVAKVLFGNINVSNSFFDSFRNDYSGFDKWYKRKSDGIAYVCYFNKVLVGFLYLKIEDPDENYRDITPVFKRAKRLKIGTLKVGINGYRIGERFLKIVFDNALINKVEEIYVTIFGRTPEQLRLIELLEDWGFVKYGMKNTSTGDEMVYNRPFNHSVDIANPKFTFPFVSGKGNVFFVPIYPGYHTELLPDSILNTESPQDYRDNEPHRNALSKVYISHSYERNLNPGDIILFYRTGGKYAGVVTTIGVVEKIHSNIPSPQELFSICKKKTFFTNEQLLEFWNKYPSSKPFVVDFLYVYSLAKRPNLARLVELGIIPDIMSVPRGFSKITIDQLHLILKESKSDESFIID
ncbi:MAG: PIN domain-containing protein [Ferruginibacter sp.]